VLRVGVSSDSEYEELSIDSLSTFSSVSMFLTVSPVCR